MPSPRPTLSAATNGPLRSGLRVLLAGPSSTGELDAQARSLGLDLVSAPSIEVAFDDAGRTDFAAVVLPARPAASALSFVRRIRVGNARTAILLADRDPELRTAVEAMRAGADDVLSFPKDAPAFARRLAAALERRRALADRFERERHLERALLARDGEIARRRHEVEAVFLKGVRSLVLSLEAKDPYTKHHSKKVASLADRIAKRLGLGPSVRRGVRIAGLLHDVGKIGIDEAVLRKPGPLTPSEFEEIKRHPLVGERILQPLRKRSPDIVRAVKHEHERFDGGGYPAGLRGYEIPLGARVIAVADAYDALTSDRPYRKGRGREAALGVLRENAGTQFDPDVVRAFLDLDPPGPERLSDREEGAEDEREDRPAGA